MNIKGSRFKASQATSFGIALITVSAGLFLPPRLQALDLDPQRVGHISGVPTGFRAIAVSGNYAYLISGYTELQVLDISNPANPKGVSTFTIGYYLRSIAVSGNYAYVVQQTGWDGTNYLGTLHVIDISNPANPTRTSAYDMANSWDIAISGPYAYIAGSEGLTVIDISDSANLRPVGSVAINGATDVTVSGSYAYVLQRLTRECDDDGDCYPVVDSGGLHVINISDPARPYPASFYPIASDGSAVAVSGNYTYLLLDNEGLMIIDSSNPAQPQRVGGLAVSGSDELVLSGNYAYVGGSSLLLVDTSRPDSPQLLRRYFYQANGIAISGNHVYVAGYSELVILDVSDENNPRRFGGYDTDGNAYGLAISGDYAYVAYGAAGLLIADVTNPANSQRVGSYTTAGEAYGVAVSTNYAYLAESPRAGADRTNLVGGGLEVIDITDPANPQPVGQYLTGGFARRVALSGNFAYVLQGLTFKCDYDCHHEGIAGIHVIDISNPANPQRVAWYQTTGPANGIASSGNYVYLAEGRRVNGQTYVEGGLHVIDITDPANPQRVSRYPINASDVAVSGNYACVAAPLGGLQVLDVSDPANPRHVGGYGLGSLVAWEVAVSGRHASVLVRDLGLLILDIAEPENPRLVGVYRRSIGGVSALDVATSDNYVFVAGGESDVEIIDVSPPANPQRLGSYTAGYAAGDVAVSGDYAYVAGRYPGLQVIDVSNPARPIPLGRYVASGQAASAVVVSGSYAYVADRVAGLQVINISDPANPRPMGGYSLSAWDVAVSGTYAYVTEAWGGNNVGGLHVIDISNPANPQRIGGWLTNGTPHYSIAVSGNYAYTLDGSGLMVFDVTDPSNPQPVSSYIGYIGDLAIYSHYLYVASYDSRWNGTNWTQEGLHVFDITNPANPLHIATYAMTDLAKGAITVDGNYAYMAGEKRQLVVVDVSNPANLHRVGENPNVDVAGLTVSNHKLFVAGLEGLVILHEYQPIRFEQVARQDSAAMRLRIAGPPGVPGRVQRSGDLQTWTNWLPVEFGESVIELSDPEARSAAASFYRIAVP